MNNSHDKQKVQNEDTVFLLRVQFRRNSSWQGTLQCLTTRQTCVFRSVLELGSLMNEAMAQSAGIDSEKKLGLFKWEDKEDVS